MSEGEATTAVQAAPDLMMLCRVNGEVSPTIHRDEPLVLSIELIRTSGERVNRINLPAAGLVAFFGVRVLEQGEWRDPDWKLHLLSRYADEQDLELTASRPLGLELGMDPAEVDGIPGGEVLLKVTANLSRSEHVESDVVHLNFAGDEMTTGEQAGYARRGEFYLRRRAYDSAIADARRLLEADPSSIDGLILMGDVLDEMGELPESLSFYVKALEEFQRQFPESFEPPASLMMKIGGVQDRILNP